MYADKQIKEVFVFGAGASHASAETPLGSKLVWTYPCCCTFTEIKQGKPDLTEENIEFANLAKFFDLVEQVYPELKGEKNRWEEIRKRNTMYYPPSDLDKKYYIDEMVKILQERKNIEGIELIRQLVLEHITRSGKGMRNSLYDEFVKRLVGKSSKNVSIISLNFDCLLHRDLMNKIYFDYLINFDEIEDSGTSYNKKERFPLIKLNGSLDWAICQGCKKVTLMPYSVDKDSYDNRNCKNCGDKLKPYIFLPHEGKDELVSILWEKAREALKQASKITVIGYSFPYYDKDIIKLFKEYTNNNAIMEIVDCAEHADKNSKEKEIQERFKNIFQIKKNMKILLCGFEGYIKET